MNGSARERLNVRTIEVTLRAALRHADGATRARAIETATLLLAMARQETRDSLALSEIVRLQQELADGRLREYGS